MTKTYQVNGLDGDGCTLVSREAYTLKAARAEMLIIDSDPEYFGAGLARIEVLDDETGECLLDRIVSGRGFK